MKRVAIADIHFSEFKDDKIIDGLPRRLHDIQKVLLDVCNYCRANNIKNIDILGDLNNDKNIIYTDSQNIFKNIIIEYKDIVFSIISGNHDLSSVGDNQTSAIQVFEGYENVKCYVDTPGDLDDCTVLPFSNRMNEYFDKLKPNNILLSHFGLSEAMLQSGISIISNIKMSDLNKFKLVLLGHYHKPQYIENKNTKLWYTGNIIHLNWSDKNEQKRFLVYDTETLEVESVPITGILEYKEFVITDDNKDNIISLIDQSKEEKENGNIVRVIRKTKDVKDKDKDFSDQGIMVVDDTEVDITQRGISVEMTEDDRFKRYMEIKEIDEKEIDEYLNIVKKIIDGENIIIEEPQTKQEKHDELLGEMSDNVKTVQEKIREEEGPKKFKMGIVSGGPYVCVENKVKVNDDTIDKKENNNIFDNDLELNL